jgi:prepilin-type N-terminal cleavage/methylation domain-containing protein
MGKKGFTLIELMIVIAIVGILSSVIIINLNSARQKATDANTKIELSSVRRAAEIYYSGSGNETYGNNANSCNAASSMFKQDTVIDNIVMSLEATSGINVTCRSSGTNFAISANLISPIDPTVDNWCVDSSGASRAVADPPVANVPFCS